MPRNKVLVIDPDDETRAAIRNLLHAAGYEVTTVDSAFGATRALAREEAASVVLDMSLPALPGEKLIEVWCARDMRGRLTIVGLTDEEPPLFEGPASGTGADATLKKDDALRLLVPTLSALLYARSRGPSPFEP